MRNDHSIAGTTILETTLEDADNTQFFIDGKTNPVVKVGRWTLRRFGVQHHRQSVAMKGKVGLQDNFHEHFNVAYIIYETPRGCRKTRFVISSFSSRTAGLRYSTFVRVLLCRTVTRRFI